MKDFKKASEKLGMLFEGRTLHRPARIEVARQELQYAFECGEREENEAIRKLCEDGYVRDDIIEDISARFKTDGKGQLEEFYSDNHLHGINPPEAIEEQP